MKLHTVIGSPNSHKVEAVIDHLGLEVEIVHHDVRTGLHDPDYLALNPNAMVPTLVDGAFTLFESNAIMQYLADLAGSDALFPRDPRKRADIVRWQCWELAHFNKAFGTLAFETVAKPRLGIGPANEALVALAAADLARFAPVLDRHLAGRSHMVGEAITLADYSMITLDAYRGSVPFDFTPFANLGAYFDRLGKSEHWLRTARGGAASPTRNAQAA